MFVSIIIPLVTNIRAAVSSPPSITKATGDEGSQIGCSSYTHTLHYHNVFGTAELDMKV